MLYYDEIFYSIQGEARNVGTPTIFIRLYGCPIDCSYCDTKQGKGKRISVENIINALKNYKGVNHVCITGGEPMIYEELLPLTWELLHLEYKVEIETSGCFPIEIEPYVRTYRYIMDVKCPSSGVEDKNIYDNLLHLMNIDDVVFVMKDREDYLFARKILKKYPTSAKVYFSPMFQGNRPLIDCQDLINWILEDKIDVNISVQMHKFLSLK